MQEPLSLVSGPEAPNFTIPSPVPSPGLLGSPCATNGLTASNLSLGIGLILGTLASFLPQYYSIYRRKSTEGLNIGTIALGVTSSVCIFLNFCYLKWDDKWDCCKQTSFGRCLANTMDGMQILSTLVSTMIWAFMWIFYFKIDDSEDGGVIRSYDEIESRRKLVRWVQLGMGGALMAIFMNILFAALLNTSFNAVNFASWVGFLLGLLGTGAIIVQWAPQIWTTFRLRSAGSLSLAMLLIQLPGTLVVIYFQGFVNKAHWSTVLPYAVCVVEFLILIALCVFFMARDRWQMWQAQKLADSKPEYKFAHLDETIASTRITVPTTSADEQEAESMMNLEFDEDSSLQSDVEDEDFSYRSHPTAPLSETMAQVQRLLPSFKQKDITSSLDKPVQLDTDDDNFGLGYEDD